MFARARLEVVELHGHVDPLVEQSQGQLMFVLHEMDDVARRTSLA